MQKKGGVVTSASARKADAGDAKSGKFAPAPKAAAAAAASAGGAVDARASAAKAKPSGAGRSGGVKAPEAGGSQLLKKSTELFAHLPPFRVKPCRLLFHAAEPCLFRLSALHQMVSNTTVGTCRLWVLLAETTATSCVPALGISPRGCMRCGVSREAHSIAALQAWDLDAYAGGDNQLSDERERVCEEGASCGAAAGSCLR